MLISFFQFVIILCSTWLIGFAYYTDMVKSNFYVNTDDEFMARLDKTFNASLKAQAEMIHWLSFNLSYDVLFFTKDSTRLKLCIGVMTKSRNNGPIPYDYVSQTIVSILARTKLANQANIRIVLFNADQDSADLDQKLSRLVHIEQIQKPSSIRVDLKNYVNDKKVLETVDYLSVMRALYKYKDCEYSLLVEDDSIAAPDWYERLVEALNEIKLRNSNWICLKLFTGLRWFDWLLHVPTVLSSLLRVVFFTLLQTLVFLKMQSRVFRNSKKVLIPISFFVNLLIFTAVINSSVINPLGHGVKLYSQGFNTVALVFPREQLKLFSDYLDTHLQKFFERKLQFVPKDELLHRYKIENKLDEFLIEPSLFQHVGVHSSVRHNLDQKPQNIKNNQYRPFQSYSFMKNYGVPVTFDPVYWTSRT